MATTSPPPGVITILAVEHRNGATHFVCRRQGSETTEGECGHYVNEPLGTVSLDGQPAVEIAETLAVWTALHRPVGVSTTLVALARRHGIELPAGLTVIDLSRR